MLLRRRRAPALLVAAFMAVVAATACAPRSAGGGEGAAADPDVPRRLEVLFLGQTGNMLHEADRFAPILHAALAPEGINLSYAGDVTALHPDTLAPYDALILYANYDSITPAQEQALLDFVAGGKGFLPIHSASASFRNSPAYVELVGAQIKGHGGEEFTAEFVQPDHPVLKGIEPFRVWDETYVHQKHNTDRTVLLERVDSAGREPWAWTRTHGKGRVFYTAYGHGEQTWTHPSFHHLLRNAILWAVGPEARRRLDQLAIRRLDYTDDTLPPHYVTSYAGTDRSRGGDRTLPMPVFQEPLEPAEALKHFQVPPGFEVQLFASEPDVVNPFAMTWDERGRLWIVETDDYPNNKQPLWQGHDRIKILEDTDGDGKADKFTVFAEGLSIPTTLTLANGGVLVGAAPEMLFLKDTTGDDRADIRQVVMTGWRLRDTHFGISNLRYGFDNQIWGAVGGDGFSGTIGTREYQFGPGIYRFTADSQWTSDSVQLEYLTDFSNNTWGLALSESFDIFGSTANNEHSTYVAIPERLHADVRGLSGEGRERLDGHFGIRPNTFRVRQVDARGGFTAATGHSFYTARSFPQEYWNRIAFVNEPTAHLVHRAILKRKGAGFTEEDGWNLIASDDEWFSPIQTDVGPDGAVWVLDWYHFVVQHSPFAEGQQSGKHAGWKTPYRGNGRGRIYRVVWKGAKPSEPMTLSKDRPKELVAALGHDNLFWRLTAQRLLVERGQTDVLDALYDLAEDEQVDATGLAAPALHALWTLHGLGAMNDSQGRALELAYRALVHPSAPVRKNALMMLPKTEAALAQVLASGVLEDPDLNVRLTAVLTLAEMPVSKAAGRRIYQASTDSTVIADEWLSEAVYIAAARHTDGFLDAYAADVGLAEFVNVAARAAAGEIDSFPNYSAPDLDDSDWRSAELSALWFEPPPRAWNQVTWVRREFTVPRYRAGQPVTLRLGLIAMKDVTYINGTRIGGEHIWPSQVREYTVPAGVLKPGRNVLAVRVTNSARQERPVDNGGMYIAGDGLVIPLATGLWKVKVTDSGLRTRRREIHEGASIAAQFLVHYGPLQPLQRLASAAKAEEPSPRNAFAARTPPPMTTVHVGVAPGGDLRFDRPTLNVKARQPVRLVFANTAKDVQHNLVLFDRLPANEIDDLVSKALTDPKSANRGFVPASPSVLHHTKLLEPQQSATLAFAAPAAPGDYLYLCTFPGHSQSMRGVLHVER